MKNQSSRPVRRTAHRFGGTALTAAVIVAVILLNMLFSFLADRGMWQVDETVTRYTNVGNISMYTPTEPFMKLVKDSVVPMVKRVNEERASRGEEPIRINVIFCADRDRIYAVEKLRYIQYTVLSLQKAFPDAFHVSYIDVKKNPSAVQKYKATSATHIYPHQIIFEFGTEYRVYTYERFFIKSDQSSTDYWAYNGEQRISSALLALTRAEAPVACFTTNHGEPLDRCLSLQKLVERAGYIVKHIDLERDPLPEDCRLLITYDPATDFRGFGNMHGSGQSEIDKLDAFLDEAYSFILFVDDETPKMPVLDEYMEEWGIKISRVDTKDGRSDNYTIRDLTQKLDADGYVPFGAYATGGAGASLTSDMRKVAYPAKVVFPHATSLAMSDSYHVAYQEGEKPQNQGLMPSSAPKKPGFRYATYYRNGVSRYMSDVFTTTPKATAEAFGEQYEMATEQNPFKLMTITSENRTVQETNYLTADEPSFVCVCASTEFASDTVLESAAYGNADVLLSALHYMGREVVPADLEFKAFKVYDVDEKAYKVNPGKNIWTTVIMTLIPLSILTAAGVVISVKRKFR